MFQFANATLKARWMSATTGSAILVFVVASLLADPAVPITLDYGEAAEYEGVIALVSRRTETEKCMLEYRSENRRGSADRKTSLNPVPAHSMILDFH
jgi:hypothetical protein